MLFVSTFLIAAQSTTDGIAIVICDGGEVANHIAEKEWLEICIQSKISPKMALR